MNFFRGTVYKVVENDGEVKIGKVFTNGQGLVKGGLQLGGIGERGKGLGWRGREAGPNRFAGGQDGEGGYDVGFWESWRD